MAEVQAEAEARPGERPVARRRGVSGPLPGAGRRLPPGRAPSGRPCYNKGGHPRPTPRWNMWTDHPDTQDLLAKARDGQPAAVERLLDVHREPLRRVIGLRLDPA